MENYWEIEWTLYYGGVLHTWQELTPTARQRVRHLVGKGKNSGRLNADDFE